MKSIKKVGLLIALTILMCTCFILAGLSFKTVSAATTLSPTTFEMEVGTSAKLTEVTGLRFRVKLDTETKNKIVNEENTTLTFIITPKVFVTGVNSFKTVAQKITMVADEDKFYQENDGTDLWYSNCVIVGIKEANYKLDYSCVAFITDGTTTVYTSNYTYNNLYATLNSALLDTEYPYAWGVFGFYNWFGNESYPLIVGSQKQLDYVMSQRKELGNPDWTRYTAHAPIGVKSAYINVVASYVVTFNDVDGSLLKKVSVKAGETVAKLPLVISSYTNKVVKAYTYNDTDFTVDTVINQNMVVTAKLTDDVTPTFVVDRVEAEKGDTDVAVNISIVNNPGIASTKLTVGYDKTKLTVTGYTINSDLDGQTSKYSSKAKTIAPLWVNGEDNMTDDCVFVTVYFTVLDTADAINIITISYDEDDVYNIDEDNVAFNTVYGSIITEKPVQLEEYTNPTFVVDTVTANKGDTDVEVNISVKKNPGIASIKVTVGYDKTKLKVTGYLINSDLEGQTSKYSSKAKTIAPLWVNGEDNMTDDCVFVTVYFTVLDTADEINEITITYDPDDVYDIDEENVDFDIVNGAIVVEQEQEGATEISYSWSADNLSCTATKTLQSDGSIVATETVNSTSVVKQQKTCQQVEITEFTATFTNSAFETQVKEAETASKLEHSFTNYVSDDNASCTEDGTKTAYCDYGCGEHNTITDEGSATGHNLVDGICTKCGKSTRPTFKVDTVNANLGDTEVAVDIYIENNPGIASVKLTVGYDKTKLTVTGYTINSDLDGQTSKYSSKAKTIAPLWVNGEDNMTDDCVFVTVYFTVLNTATRTNTISITYDPDDVYDIDEDNVTFDLVDGAIIVEEAEEEVTVIGYSWSADYSTCTATVTRQSDSAVLTTETVSSTSVITQQKTCQQVEKKTYTAEFTNSLFTTQVKNVESLDKAEHSYTSYTSNNDATLTEDGTKTAHCDYGCGQTDTITDTNSNFSALPSQNLGSVAFGKNIASKEFELNTNDSVRGVYLNDIAITTGYTIDASNITIANSIFSENGEYTIKIAGLETLYIINVEVVDYALGTKEDFVDWFNNYGENYNQNSTVILTANIDLSGTSFGYVSGTERCNLQFNGTFDGRGYNIANLTTYYGFMSTATTGVIKNVSFTNFVNTNAQYSGGFFAKTTAGTLQDIYVEGYFTGGELPYSQGALGLQSNNAKEIINLVIILHQNANGDACTDQDGNSYIIGQYALGTSSMYIVNEIATVNVAQYGNYVGANTYANVDEFKADVTALPDDFNSTYWTMYNGILTMKNAVSFYDDCTPDAITSVTINSGDVSVVAGKTNTITTNIQNVNFVISGLKTNQYTLSDNQLTIDLDVASETTFSITAYYYAYGVKYISKTLSNIVVENNSKIVLQSATIAKNRTSSTYTYSVGSGEEVSSLYVDGVSQDTSLVSISNGILSIPASSFDGGEYNIKIVTTNKVISLPLIVADYAIGTSTEFSNWYNNASDYWDKYIALTANVTLAITTKYTSPTDTFTGTFNGNGYTIYNFYSTQGLFYHISGTFKDTAVVNTKTAYSYSNFMGYNATNATISNVFYQGTQSGNWDNRAQVPAFYSYGVVSSNIKNVVVIVDRNTGNSSDPISSAGGNDVSSLYVVNNCSRGESETCRQSNFYASVSEFKSDISFVPEGFDTDIWTIKDGLLTFKSAANYVSSISVYLNRSTTSYKVKIGGTTVSSVYVNDTKITSTRYSLKNGVFTLSSNAFTSSGDKFVYITTNTGKYIIYAQVVDYAIGTVKEFNTWYATYSSTARGIDSSDDSMDTYGTYKRVILTADIDFGGVDLGNAVTDYWYKSDVGAGNSGNIYFIGSFDGRGYTLSNFTSSVGLFPGVTASGVIKNLNMTNFTVTGSYGLLGNTFNGTMINCNIEGKVNSTDELAGSLWNVIGENAIIRGVNVTVTSDNDNSSIYGVAETYGAIAGNVSGLIVINSNCNNMCATDKETIQGVKLATSSNAIVGYNLLDYKIVCANDAGDRIWASNFVTTHLNTALGANITTVSTVSDWSDSDKLIIFGNETLFKEQLANAGKTFDESAYYILKVGNTVFIYASDSEDYKPAAIKFLELAIGFEDYGNSTIAYTNIPEEMPEMYYENVVTFKNRITGYSSAVSGLKTVTEASNTTTTITSYNELDSMGYTSNLYMRIPNRYYYEGLTTDADNYGTVIQSHTAFYILPPEMYQESHGAFYSTTCKNFDMASSYSACSRDYNQLCYTARSDDYPGELEVMKETVLDYLKVIVKLSYNINLEYLPIQIMDNAYCCQCSACQRIGATKSQILFMNDVVERLNDWLHSDEGGNDSRTIKIAILAYKGFVDAPTDGTKCSENVVVQLAPINAYYGKAITDSVNDDCRENIVGWANACSDSELHVWLYQSHFPYLDYSKSNVVGGYVLPLDTWDYTVGWYSFLKENGVTQIFNQGAHTAKVLTGFGYLKNYIDSKAEIDVDYVLENYDEIVTNYFNNYFGSVAGAKMKEFFEAYKAVIKSRTSTGALSEYVFKKITYSDLSGLNAKLKAVYTALEAGYSDKTDPNYLAYKNRIDIESISLRFLIAAKGWSSYMTSSYYTTTKAGVYSDMVALGFTSYGEGYSMDDLKTYWSL